MTSRDDGAFVDALLRQAQSALGDPRIQVVHVRHAGPPPADAPDAGSASDTNAAASAAHRAAWTQTVELATTLRDLWGHAWLPAPPDVAGVRYLESSTGLRVEVTGQAHTADVIDVDPVADRLLVRGFLPDEQSSPGRIRAHHRGAELVIDTSGDDISMTLTEALDVREHTTVTTLSVLPHQVSTISDRR